MRLYHAPGRPFRNSPGRLIQSPCPPPPSLAHGASGCQSSARPEAISAEGLRQDLQTGGRSSLLRLSRATWVTRNSFQATADCFRYGKARAGMVRCAAIGSAEPNVDADPALASVAGTKPEPQTSREACFSGPSHKLVLDCTPGTEPCAVHYHCSQAFQSTHAHLAVGPDAIQMISRKRGSGARDDVPVTGTWREPRSFGSCDRQV